MYPTLLSAHSYLRYLVLALLIVVIVTSVLGWLKKRSNSGVDNKLSLYLLIATHLQFVIGLVLYFVSPGVRFGSDTMKDSVIRYWTVEHVFMMLVAVGLITAARSTSKKMTEAASRHKRMFILNFVALLIILVAIAMSKRGII